MRWLPPARVVPYHRSMRTFLTCSLVTLTTLSGCGLATYEQRLEQTAEYFEYHQMLNDRLASSAWSGQLPVVDNAGQVQLVPVGASMRIPLGFTKLTGPEPILNPSDQNLVVGFAETRQPSYLHEQFQLPGIVDAWEMRTNAGIVRLYALGNYEYLLQQAGGDSVDPTLYFEDLRLRLQQGFGVGFVADGAGSPTDVNRFYSARFPAVEKFQVIKDFNVINIAPAQPFEGIEYAAQLYEVYEADTDPVRFAILCIFPAEERANVVDPLELALETLTVSNQPPQRPDERGSGGGGF